MKKLLLSVVLLSAFGAAQAQTSKTQDPAAMTVPVKATKAEVEAKKKAAKNQVAVEGLKREQQAMKAEKKSAINPHTSAPQSLQRETLEKAASKQRKNNPAPTVDAGKTSAIPAAQPAAKKVKP
jgi:predicted outer membrane protein